MAEEKKKSDLMKALSEKRLLSFCGLLIIKILDVFAKAIRSAIPDSFIYGMHSLQNAFVHSAFLASLYDSISNPQEQIDKKVKILKENIGKDDKDDKKDGDKKKDDDKKKDGDKKKEKKEYKKKDPAYIEKVAEKIGNGMIKIFNWISKSIIGVVLRIMKFILLYVWLLILVTFKLIIHYMKSFFLFFYNALRKLPILGILPKIEHDSKALKNDLKEMVFLYGIGPITKRVVDKGTYKKIKDQGKDVHKKKKEAIMKPVNKATKTIHSLLGLYFTAWIEFGAIAVGLFFRVVLEIVREIVSTTSYTKIGLALLGLLIAIGIILAPGMVSSTDISMNIYNGIVWTFRNTLEFKSELFVAIGISCISLIASIRMMFSNVKIVSKTRKNSNAILSETNAAKNNIFYTILSLGVFMCAVFAIGRGIDVIAGGPDMLMTTLPAVFLWLAAGELIRDIRMWLLNADISIFRQAKSILLIICVVVMAIVPNPIVVIIFGVIAALAAIAVSWENIEYQSTDTSTRNKQIGYILFRVILVLVVLVLIDESLRNELFKVLLYLRALGYHLLGLISADYRHVLLNL
ncbi:hypothetical protein NEOKW01_1147 [Nematocida sp. AWRm80]|nr:hypothetical protein NEOKW01_1147 [Nematocida sp. AWRm80]